MKNNKLNIKRFAGGFAAGSAAGIAAALLFAPKSGRELRRDIAVKKDEIIHETGRKAHQIRVKANKIVSGGKEMAAEMIERSKTGVKNIADKAGSIVNSGLDMVSGTSGKLVDAAKSGIEAFREERRTSGLKENENKFGSSR